MMKAEFFDRLGKNSNVEAIKDSSGDIAQLHRLASDYPPITPHITLLCGMDDQALEFFAWGARGWVCGAGNFLPGEHLAIYRTCVLENDFAKARKLMSAMLPLMRLLEQGGKFVQSIKYGCTIAGLPSGPVRKPLQELTGKEKRDLELVVRNLRRSIRDILDGASENEDAPIRATGTGA